MSVAKVAAAAAATDVGATASGAPVCTGGARATVSGVRRQEAARGSGAADDGAAPPAVRSASAPAVTMAVARADKPAGSPAPPPAPPPDAPARRRRVGRGFNMGAAQELVRRNAHVFRAGHAYDRYSFGRTLGSGIFSTVVEGKDRVTGERVAVKVVDRTAVRSARQEAIILNEVDILKTISEEIQHPNLCRVIAAYREASRYFIIMKLCTGGELFERLEKVNHFTESQASNMTKKLVSALQALHDKDIIHRDLKPENILLADKSPNAELLITDFGLSMNRGVDWHTNKVGSPAYVAPEVLLHHIYTPACDVWAMGVILYILLVGFPPFYGDSDADVFAMITSGAHEYPSPYWDVVSSDAKDLVQRMLTVDFSKRITTRQILAHPWIVNHQPRTVLKHVPAGLKKMRLLSKFKAAAYACMLGARLQKRQRLRTLLKHANFTAKELTRMRSAFYKSAPNGQVTRVQFRTIMEDLGWRDLPYERLFTVFDTHKSSTVDFKEFLVGLSTLRCHRDNREDALKLIFQVYDESGSGYISRLELANVLRAMVAHHHGEREMAEDEFLRLLNLVFESMDVVGDNRISFDEFKAGLQDNPMLSEAFLQPLEHVASDDGVVGGGRTDASAGAGAGGSGPGRRTGASVSDSALPVRSGRPTPPPVLLTVVKAMVMRHRSRKAAAQLAAQAAAASATATAPPQAGARHNAAAPRLTGRKRKDPTATRAGSPPGPNGVRGSGAGARTAERDGDDTRASSSGAAQRKRARLHACGGT